MNKSIQNLVFHLKNDYHKLVNINLGDKHVIIYNEDFTINIYEAGAHININIVNLTYKSTMLLSALLSTIESYKPNI